MRRLVAAPLLVLATFVVVGASMFTAGAFEDSFHRLLPVSQLEREGVVYFEDLDSFAVRTQRGPLVLQSRRLIDGHFHSPDRVIFCRSSRLFEAEDSKFDRRGRYLGGPATRGLDRPLVRISDGWVLADPETVVPGGPRPETTREIPLHGPFCRGWGARWEEIEPGIGVPAR
jgi:hypothetical protein